MNLVNYLLPPKTELFAIQNPRLKNECINPSRNNYKEIGLQVHRALPYTVNSVAASILLNCSTVFTNTYCEILAKRFIRLCQKEKLRVCDKKIITLGVDSFFCLKKHPSIKKCCLSINDIFYIKGDRFHPVARGALEKLIWKCAKILDMDHYFAPTFMTDKLKCLQLHIDGLTLAQMIDNNFVGLDKKQVITGLILTLFFGFTDAHSDNIVVDPASQIHFVDNSRCFPHSNGCIKIPDLSPVRDFLEGSVDNCEPYPAPLAPFRSGLMESPFAFSALDSEDWKLLEGMMCLFLDRLPLILREIASAESGNFPAHWFEADQIVNALTNRVVIMEQSIEKRNFGCMRDLIFQVHPHYRFFVGLTLASKHVENKPTSKLMAAFSRSQNKEKDRLILQMRTFNDVCGKGFDMDSYLSGPTYVPIAELWDKCMKSNVSFDEIIDWIAQGEGVDYNRSRDVNDIMDVLIQEANWDYKY